MKLVSLELSGFRGFARDYFFDLDASAIIVFGANGNGKTSFLDAILWALTGAVPRLRSDDSQLVFLFSDSGVARASLVLRDSDQDETFTVTRSTDGESQRVSVYFRGKKLTGAAASAELIARFWPDAAAAEKPDEAFADVVARCTYLQQDSIRSFIEANSEESGFEALSQLVGIGRVTELKESLEKSKKAWSTATNQRGDIVRGLKSRALTYQTDLADQQTRMDKNPLQRVDDSEWRTWIMQMTAAGVPIGFVEPGAREAAAVIDTALKRLDGIARAAQRRKESLDILELALQRESSVAPEDISLIKLRLSNDTSSLDTTRERITLERQRLEQARSLELELQVRGEQTKTMAALALQQLGPFCPVCQQSYNRAETERHLRSVIEMAGKPPEVRVSESILAEIARLSRELEETEIRLSRTTHALRVAEQRWQEWQIHLENTNARFSDLGLVEGVDGNKVAVLQAAQSIVERQSALISTLRSTGESFALRLSSAAAELAIEELTNALDKLQAEITEGEHDIANRTKTGELGQVIIEALREAASMAVRKRLEVLGPLLQGIWSRIDPHPAFRMVELLTETVRGRGRLSTILKDPNSFKESRQPSVVLSSSQMNALAVSVFLSLI